MAVRVVRGALVCLLAASIALQVVQGQSSQIAVGEGAPTSTILNAFLQAYLRSGFSTFVALPPTSKVRRDGSGYAQDFDGTGAATGFAFALAKPDSLENAYQMCCQILALHRSIGSFSGKVSYPVSDPNTGPGWPPEGAGSLQQNFDGGHAIFVHQGGPYNGQAFFIRDPFVSRWRVTPALSLPIGQERDAASRFSTTAVQQDFFGGVIVQITSGARQDQVYVVSGPIYQRYAEIFGTASWLGFPIGDETIVSGRQRQNFEGGLIEYTPGSGLPAEARAPVFSISIDATPLSLQVGNVITRVAQAFDGLGNAVTGRPFVWTTSNRAVVQLEANGATATLRAVGPGFANIVAFVDGVSSGTLRITVTSACCQVGEGAPTLAIRQALQDALSRNNITPRLPADNSVRRFGSGYGQEFIALTPENLGRVLVVKSDTSALAYLVTGARLARYLEFGGPTGVLGFPTSDVSAAGRQDFENQFLLAGAPPALVAPPVTHKWAALRYEAGPAGSPRGDAGAPEPSIFGAVGVAQAFAGGVIYGHTAGSRSGQAFLVSGPILARYVALSGPPGVLGLPISDAAPAGNLTRQSFEGGSIEFAEGDTAARERLNARAPAVSVLPPVVPPGGRVRVSISGFTPGRRLLVTIGAGVPFEITSASGAYSWDHQIRPGGAPGSSRITARDPESGETAEASFRVRAVDEIRYQLAKISGDNQTALPASVAAFPLVVRLTDENNQPIAGVRVVFGSVAGGVTAPADAITDPDGYARTSFRLPPATGLSLATAEAASRIVTFAARAEDSRLSGFPTFRQSIDDLRLGGGAASIHQKGSLLTALAALYRYYQDRGELPAPNGLAEPGSLNQFLLGAGFLRFTLNNRTELVVSLPPSLAFTGDAADFETVAAEPAAIRDSLNLRRPVLLGLMLRSGDQDRGAHYVVANGVGPDGTVLIYDPSPDWNRTTLSEYLNGFTALGRPWTARILHALQLRIEPRPRRGFLVSGSGPGSLRLAAPAASRGYSLRLPALASFDELATDSGEAAQLVWSDGAAPQYQLTVPEGATAAVQTAGPFARGAYRIVPEPFSVAPQSLTAAADGLRNAAGFGSRLAPGSLASLFGAGLGDAVAALSLSIGGRPAPLLFVSSFQANLQIPYELAPGSHAVEIASPFGAARFDAVLNDAAPGVFVLDTGRAAVLNQDGTLNTVANPAVRGSVLQVFVTGLGTVAPSVSTGARAPASPLSRAVATLSATLDDRPTQVLFAGLAPGFVGLGQVNLLVPATLPPNVQARLVLQAGGVTSNAVAVSMQ